MKYINKILIGFILCISVFSAVSFCAYGEENSQPLNTVCVAYITGIGCSNCAVADPILFRDTVSKYPNLIIFDYEVYHAAEANQRNKDDYFKNYFPGQSVGVPTLILSKSRSAIGRIKVVELLKQFGQISSNACPMPDGSSVDFNNLDLTKLSGKINIWTKNRVLSTAKAGGDNQVLKQLLLAPSIWKILGEIPYKKIEPTPIEISQNVMIFQNAIRVGDWTLQWNDYGDATAKGSFGVLGKVIPWLFIIFMATFIFVLFVRIQKTEKGFEFKLRDIEKKQKDYLVVALSMLGVVIFFIFARMVNPSTIEKAGYFLPLPLFTLIIGLLDGVNPCNMFVLTCLMALLVSTSHSKMRLYVVGMSFVATCFVLYFLFMAAWLNVFQYVRFVTPLRVGIGLLALIAGFINCKELLFFKEGISLTIPDEQRGFLMKKIYAMKKSIEQGSFPLLVWSSFALAILSSLVEIPCTAGFPIIYTGILSG
ncbi:MAG: hypothetical protein NT079_04855, partial [Candidatus Omnitrophica bacterium]|nr:hypothetical protein [Candidatus Omnitrophota bacterium]